MTTGRFRGRGQVDLTGRDEPERINVVRATASLFPALGVAPWLGRAFTPEEDRPGAAQVADPESRLLAATFRRRSVSHRSIVDCSAEKVGR